MHFKIFRFTGYRYLIEVLFLERTGGLLTGGQGISSEGSLTSEDGKSSFKVLSNNNIILTDIATKRQVFRMTLTPVFKSSSSECELIGCLFMCKTSNNIYWMTQTKSSSRNCQFRIKPDAAGIEIIDLDSKRSIWPSGGNEKGFFKKTLKGNFALIVN